MGQAEDGAEVRHGGALVVEQLARHGVRRVFSVPGESFLAVLDALHDSGIANVVCRHEGGAAMAAEAHGKLTGTPGIALVTRGPGATNAAAGVHVARQDSTPMVLLVGQIETGHRDREAFQEMDYRAVFGSIANWVAEVDRTERLAEYVNRALAVASAGRPGPVVLALPEDVLSAPTSAQPLPVPARPEAPAERAELARIAEGLMAAERPLIVAGGGRWSEAAARDLQGFAERHGLPVAVPFRRQDHIDNRSDAYVGDLSVGMNPRLAARLAEADRLLLLGTRLGDIPTAGFSLLDPARGGPDILHVHPDPDELGTLWPASLALAADPVAVAAGLATLPAPPAPHHGWREALRADYLNWQLPDRTPGAVRLEEIVRWLSNTLPEDAIVTNGAGNYAAWVHRYFRFKRYGTQVAPTSGSMGYGLPAAIAAKLEHPSRKVVCFAGDGCFQMTGNEFSTAVQHGANVVVIVCNNGRYGTIRMHQERTYPGRVSGTELRNPDFAALAQAHGGHGEKVLRTEDFPKAFARAATAGVPALLEIAMDPEALGPALTLSRARAAGEERQKRRR